MPVHQETCRWVGAGARASSRGDAELPPVEVQQAGVLVGMAWAAWPETVRSMSGATVGRFVLVRALVWCVFGYKYSMATRDFFEQGKPSNHSTHRAYHALWLLT
jgi:hypothetical protein